MQEKRSLSSTVLERQRRIMKKAVPMAAALALVGCSKETQTSSPGQQPAGTTIERPVPLDDSQEQAPAQQSHETSIDLSSPASVAWAFAEAKATGDIDTACKLTVCGPGEQLLPGQEIVPFLDELPVGQPIIQDYEDALIVELQTKNPNAGKWCLEMHRETNGNWQVRHYDNPISSDECSPPIYEP